MKPAWCLGPGRPGCECVLRFPFSLFPDISRMKEKFFPLVETKEGGRCNFHLAPRVLWLFSAEEKPKTSLRRRFPNTPLDDPLSKKGGNKRILLLDPVPLPLSPHPCFTALGISSSFFGVFRCTPPLPLPPILSIVKNLLPLLLLLFFKGHPSTHPCRSKTYPLPSSPFSFFIGPFFEAASGLSARGTLRGEEEKFFVASSSSFFRGQCKLYSEAREGRTWKQAAARFSRFLSPQLFLEPQKHCAFFVDCAAPQKIPS